jgi:serine/threonine protein kinase
VNSALGNIWNTLEGEVIDGKYHLNRLIASGGYGGVFEADEVVADQLIRQVAIKLIAPDTELAGTQIRELALAASLDCRGLVRSFSPGQCTVQNIILLYIVMELASDSLGKRLENGQVDETTARYVAESTLEALIYLGKREDPLVHRDIKPDNLLLVGQTWKLGDFGLLRGIGPSREARTGNLLGTAEYAPPEAFQGIVSPAWDIWSLGVMIVEMLTCALPFEGATPQQLQASILKGQVTGLEKLPAPFNSLAEACLRVNRENRISAQTALDLLHGRGCITPVVTPNRVLEAASGRRGAFPFRFKYGEAATIDELIELSNEYPFEAQDYLVNNYYHKWLRDALNEVALAHEARGISQYHSHEPHNALELMLRALRRAVGQTALPTVTLEPARLDFGMVSVGSRIPVSIRYDCKGVGHIWGNVRVDDNLPGLSFGDRFAADGAPIPVTLDTLETPPGLYHGDLLVWPYGFEQPIRLPVTYTVAAIRAVVTPQRIDLGEALHGEARSGVIRVASADGIAQVIGTARVFPPCPGLTVTEKFKGVSCQIAVHFDTANLEAGREYVRRIQIQTNGGKVDVPVRITVAMRTWGILAYAGIGALAGAFMFGFIRWVIAAIIGSDTQWALSLAFADTHNVDCQVVGTPILAIAVSTLFRSLCRRRWPLLFEAEAPRAKQPEVPRQRTTGHCPDDDRRIDIKEI